MFDFYCNSRGIGDSLLYTQAVHVLGSEMGKEIRLHVPKFRWYGEKYQNNENEWANPIWKNNPWIKEVTLMPKNADYNVPMSQDHQALGVCRHYGTGEHTPTYPRGYLYLSDEYNITLTRPSVGIVARAPEREDLHGNPWYYQHICDIAEFLSDADIDVYQIDAGTDIIPHTSQSFKQAGVRELCYIVNELDAVVGQTTGAIHMARALDKKIFDIWDWKRFRQHTPQVYRNYSYQESNKYVVNGGQFHKDCVVGTPEGIAADIIRSLDE